MNQELEQYLQFFIDHRQKDQQEQLTIAEFTVNKTHLVTKVFLFMANYGRELRMGSDIRQKRKVEKATEFVERMKKVQEEASVALRNAQKEIKQQVNRGRMEFEEQKGNKIMLIIKDLVFKKQPV